MSTLEIIMIIISIMLFIVSFILPDANQEKKSVSATQEEIRRMIEAEYKNKSAEWENILAEAAESMQAEAKRKLEYLTNEKIMSINEYSDQVMEGIHKNHNQVMFLYGTMNDKESSLQELLEKISLLETKQNQGKKTEEHTNTDAKKPNKKRQNQKSGNGMQELGQSLDDVFSRLEERESMDIQMDEAGSKNLDDKDIVLDEAGKRERILTLFDEGKSIKEIAKEEKFGIGEVKLVVDLYRGGKR